MKHFLSRTFVLLVLWTTTSQATPDDLSFLKVPQTAPSLTSELLAENELYHATYKPGNGLIITDKATNKVVCNDLKYRFICHLILHLQFDPNNPAKLFIIYHHFDFSGFDYAGWKIKSVDLQDTSSDKKLKTVYKSYDPIGDTKSSYWQGFCTDIQEGFNVQIEN